MWFPKSTFHATSFLQANSEMTDRTCLGGYVGTIFMDPSKAYDCLSCDLLIAKLEVHRLDIGSLNFLLDYLSLRKH